jgi:hypothetical protein
VLDRANYVQLSDLSRVLTCPLRYRDNIIAFVYAAAASSAASKPKKTARSKPMSPNDCDVIEAELKKAFVAEGRGGGFAAHLKYDSEDLHNPLMGTSVC